MLAGRDTPQDDPELIVHLDGDRTHMALDSRTENSCIEFVANFILVVPVEFMPQAG